MSSDGSVNKHIEAFGRQRDIYAAFAKELENLLRSVIGATGLPVHVIESRAKSIESFREKITRVGKYYVDPLVDLPDLCGCRIITYYSDDVKKVGAVISEQFDVVQEELAHQPSSFDADRFGYLSAHYVVKLKDNRNKLPEWLAFSNLHAEIQVRTVIQHAWSAVSHALQYKQETSVPSSLQRRLYRIAGLFELADEEFVGIREQKSAAMLKASAAITSGVTGVRLESSTIVAAIQQWDRIEEVRAAGSAAGFTVPGDDDYEPMEDTGSVVPEIYDLASEAGIKSTDDLIDSVRNVRTDLFDKIFSYRDDRGGWQATDTFLFFLLLLKKFNHLASVNRLTKYHWSTAIAERVVKAVRT